MINCPKICSVILSITLLFTQCLFAHAAETNFWAERKKSVELAQLPAPSALGPSSSRALAPLPAATLVAPQFPKRIESQIPSRNADGIRTLLAALPSRLGNVRKIVLPKTANPGYSISGPLVLHIQDIHMNNEAQRNIGALVEALAGAGKVDMVALEGAFGPLDFTDFHAFAYPAAVKNTANYLLEENKIAGPVHSALTFRPTGEFAFPSFVGVDDPVHYDANVEAYRRSMELAPRIKQDLSMERKRVEREKASVFSPSLAQFDRTVELHRAGGLPLGDYAVQLAATASANEVSAPSLKSLNLFLKALRLEKELDFKRVESDRERLLSRLVDRLSKDQTADLMEMSAAYRLGNVGHAAFYEFLEQLCGKAGLPLGHYPAMASYLRYVLLSDVIDAEKLFDELRAFEAVVFDKLAATRREKSLVQQSREQHLTEKLVDFSLTQQEWAEYKTSHHHSASAYKTFEDFYHHAEIRDEKMAQNILGRSSDDSKRGMNVSILVTGGFHAEGIERRLVGAGVTVVSYVPKISKVEDESGSAYLSVFAQEKTPLEQLFEGDRLFLAQKAFPPDLNALARLSMTAQLPEKEILPLSRSLLKKAGVAVVSVVENVGRVTFNLSRESKKLTTLTFDRDGRLVQHSMVNPFNWLPAFWDLAIPRLRAWGWTDRQIAGLSGFEDVILIGISAGSTGFIGKYVGADPTTILALQALSGALAYFIQHRKIISRLIDGKFVLGPPTRMDLLRLVLLGGFLGVSYPALFNLAHLLNVAAIILLSLILTSIHSVFDMFIAPYFGWGLGMAKKERLPPIDTEEYNVILSVAGLKENPLFQAPAKAVRLINDALKRVAETEVGTKILTDGIHTVVFKQEHVFGSTRWRIREIDAPQIPYLVPGVLVSIDVETYNAPLTIDGLKEFQVFQGNLEKIISEIHDALEGIQEVEPGTKILSDGQVSAVFKRVLTTGKGHWRFKIGDEPNISHIVTGVMVPVDRDIYNVRVSAGGLTEKPVFQGKPESVAKKINDVLSEIEESSPGTKIMGNGGTAVIFKKIAGENYWRFSEQEASKVAANVDGVILANVDVEAYNVRVSKTGLSEKPLFQGKAAKIAKRINDLLGVVEESEPGTKILGAGEMAVSFKAERSFRHIVWRFKEEDAWKIPFLVEGVYLSVDLSIYNVPITEAGLRERNLFKGSPSEQLETFKMALDGVMEIEPGTKQLGTGEDVVIFKLEKGQGGDVWRFREQDAPKLARILGLELEIDPDQQLEDLGLMTIVGSLGDRDPYRLLQIIRLLHPELAPHEIERLVRRALAGLRPEIERINPVDVCVIGLNPPIMNSSANQPHEPDHRTREPSFRIQGRVEPGVPYVWVDGTYPRKIRVQADGTFSGEVPLPIIGGMNVFEVRAYDPRERQLSEPVLIEIFREGVPEDTERIFIELLRLRADLLQQTTRDPFRRNLLLRSMELALLRSFTYDEAAGMRMLDESIENEEVPFIRKLRIEIRRKFREISEIQFNLRRPDQRLYFFQKYAIYEMGQLQQAGARGVINAMEQGLGKTLVTEMFLGAMPAFILTPNSVVSAWIRMAAKFLAEDNLISLDGPHAGRFDQIASSNRPQAVTNIEFLQNLRQENADSLSNLFSHMVIDEADFLGKKGSKQTRGAMKLNPAFMMLLTATPFKRIGQIANLLRFVTNDPRFQSPKAFSRAFSLNDSSELNALFLLLHEHMIRIRKRDVFEEYDPNMPLESQADRLPRKVFMPVDDGQFELTDVQMDSIHQLFTDYQGWAENHRGHESREDLN